MVKQKKLVCKLNSINETMKYAKANFYTLKNLLENQNLHNGFIYSYNKYIK